MTAKTATTKKASAAKPASGLQAPLTPSPALAAVVGSQALPRTEIVKKIWDYIKANGLQDQNNKRMINSDAKLKEIFAGKAQVSMFELPKLISSHVK